ncbi:hypothetical protein CMI37_31755 [Candidatus Pacearchaeota archaeon]|nr:hypothetical protein [Candidatus Pacearchaeota archaeon]|tara:strand:- start:83 stop:385 length:303 start_codon:yes stop_codon:yes gene_type:complete
MRKKKLGKEKPFKLEGNEGKDNGCEIADSCLDCPCESRWVWVEMQCKEDYTQGSGKRGLIIDMRGSIAHSLTTQGMSVAFLGEVFNVTSETIRRALRQGE